MLFRAQVDDDAGTIELRRIRSEVDAAPYVLRFVQLEEGGLMLEGTIGGVEHRATLRRVDEKKMLLVDRGFRWINEKPFNR